MDHACCVIACLCGKGENVVTEHQLFAHVQKAKRSLFVTGSGHDNADPRWVPKGKIGVLFSMDHSQHFSPVFIVNFPSPQHQLMSDDAW